MLFRQTAVIMVVDEELYWEEQILQLAFMAAGVEAVWQKLLLFVMIPLSVH